MRHPRTLLATIGVTAAAFAMVLGSVIFNAADGSGAASKASAATTRRATQLTVRYAPADADIAAGLC